MRIAPLATLVAALIAFPMAADVPPAVSTDAIDPQHDEITVTAKRDTTPLGEAPSVGKTNTPLRDIPQSIQIVPAVVMQQQGAQQLNEAIHNVSGVTQSSSSNYGFFNNYLVRGLQQTFLRDGLADGATVNGYARTLTGVERIEVLKGPGSALYGSTAPGGTINLVLSAPTSQPFFGASQSFGTFGTSSASVDLSGPMGTPLALYRLNAAYNTTDGDRGLARRTTELMPRFLFMVSATDLLSLDLSYMKANVVADTLGIPFRGTRIADVSRDNRYYTPFGDTEQSIVRAAARNEWLVSPAVSVRANASLIRRDLDLLRNAGGSVAATGLSMTDRKLRHQTDRGDDALMQVEPVLTLATGSIQQTILGGVEWQHHDVDAFRATANLPSIANIFAPVVTETSLDALRFAPNFDRTLTQSESAVYLQDQLSLGDHWKVRVGGRWDRFTTRDIDAVTKVDATRDDTPLSGQFGVVYQPTQSLSLYAGASRGHFAILSTETANSARQPESATQYEGGVKATLFGNRLAANVAAFRVDRENFLVTINGEPQPVGAQRTDGVEVDLDLSLSQQLHLVANYANQNAILLRVPVNAGAKPVDGKRATGVPPRSASLWSVYTFGPGRLSGLSVGAGASYRDALFFDQLNTQTIPSYVLADALIAYRYRAAELQLNLRNLGDRAYFRNGVNGGALPGEGRTLLVTARFAR